MLIGSPYLISLVMLITFQTSSPSYIKLPNYPSDYQNFFANMKHLKLLIIIHRFLYLL